jgi:hypothetical protein
VRKREMELQDRHLAVGNIAADAHGQLAEESHAHVDESSWRRGFTTPGIAAMLGGSLTLRWAMRTRLEETTRKTLMTMTLMMIAACAAAATETRAAAGLMVAVA